MEHSFLENSLIPINTYCSMVRRTALLHNLNLVGDGWLQGFSLHVRQPYTTESTPYLARRTKTEQPSHLTTPPRMAFQWLHNHLFR